MRATVPTLIFGFFALLQGIGLGQQEPPKQGPPKREPAKQEVPKKVAPKQELPKVAGPLVGHVGSGDAKIWIYHGNESSATLKFGLAVEGAATRSVEFKAHADPAADLGGKPALATLSGLEPESRYRYQVKIDGTTDPAWSGEFSTAAPEGKSGKFRLALTSCMRFDKPQASWYLLLAQQPDLHLTLGDTHYADTPDPKVQWRHHLRYRAMPEFATVLRNVPNYAVWDDHDYGPNDSDGTVKGKEGSLAGWRQFWANPVEGTEELPGAFFKFSRGDVEFFVVDGRYHRSPSRSPDDESKRMLGDAQFEWLLDGLKASKAKFKVVASGSTLHASKGDGWRVFTFARHRLFDALKENEISGVMYFSGDVHRSGVFEHHESERVGYPLVEVISSGVANSKSLSFATIDFDTAREDPSVRVRIVYGDGTVRDDKTWKLSQLGGK